MTPPGIFTRPNSDRFVFWFAIVLYVLFQMGALRAEFTANIPTGTDEVMRLLSVRDLLAGQSWWDMSQHRVLPPNGVSLHWSRLIDAPIAALVMLFSLFLSPFGAERLVAMIWPALLFLGFLGLTRHVAGRLAGPAAACFAMLGVAAIPAISTNYFAMGMVDHHNAQILAMLVLGAGVMVPGQPLRLGLMAGAAGAFSLAVGLEMIVIIALGGVILSLAHVVGRPGAAARLVGFGLGLGCLAPILFALQTNFFLWFAPLCDVLSPPFLALTTAAAGFCLVVVAMGRVVPAGWLRFLVTAALGVAMLLILAPVLRPCLAGPYADLPAEVQTRILSTIIEVRPAHQIMVRSLPLAITALLPLYAVVLAAAVLVLRDFAAARPQGALGLLMVFVAIPAALTFVQLRTVVMALPFLPLTFGIVADRLANRTWTVAPRAQHVAVAALIIAAAMPGVVAALVGSVQMYGFKQSTVLKATSAACSTQAEVSRLTALPPAVIFTPMNIGPAVLYFTDHSVTAAPYHRSAAALSNGMLPFGGTESDLAKAVADAGASLLMVCDGDVFANTGSIGSALGRGAPPSWLVPVDLGAGARMRLYRVNAPVTGSGG